ncbi:hypothetical protein ccrud_12055 [Corynebacterium crudilactis]|uniref:Uncharacterized protein n=1 Tax=Corynebacterium crudilactis TaxID=1652495 RepID=A0A172QVW8_9CORY|nr:hypothetical protein ccrud_12055 [Corynebacterium crudilactis]
MFLAGSCWVLALFLAEILLLTQPVLRVGPWYMAHAKTHHKPLENWILWQIRASPALENALI